MKLVYYNEFDAKKAAWLRELINEGAISDGEIDTRSIRDVQPGDLRGFTRCHFFAGIGVWDYALDLAGWGDRPVWTGSCPCQPFSAAGKQRRASDERHLFPAWMRLIDACRPPIIFGEQVSAAIGPSYREDQVLPEMQDREAVLRVLYQLQRESPLNLQGLRERSRANKQAEESGEGKQTLYQMAQREARTCSCQCSQISSFKEGNGVRSGSGRHPGANRFGDLRTNRDPLLFDGAESLECSIFGSYRPGQGLHEGQHSGGALCIECNGECLGDPADLGDLVGDHGPAQETQQRLTELLGDGIDAALGNNWLDHVQAELASKSYTFGSSVLGACSVGAPHIRHRLWWVAESQSDRRQHESQIARGNGEGMESPEPGRKSCIERNVGRMALSDERRRGRRTPNAAGFNIDRTAGGRHEGDGIAGGSGPVRGLGHSRGAGLPLCECKTLQRAGRREEGRAVVQPSGASAESERPGPVNGFWRNADWLRCRDGRWRPVESPSQRVADELALDLGFVRDPRSGEWFSFPLQKGAKARTSRLRGYGDAIVSEVAAEFIRAYMEAVAA